MPACGARSCYEGSYVGSRQRPRAGGQASPSAPPLQQLFVDKLAASGLDLKDARALRFVLVKSAAQLHPEFPPCGAFQLPYFDLQGRPTKFYRVRYLESTLNGFAAQTERSELRYVQPPGTLSEVYLPPLVDWGALARDASRPLTVTEGELKAAAATKAGLPTLGLGGVWSFKAARAGVPFLPLLAAIDWQGREVRVAFDSDALSNPDVLKALHVLCTELAARGARPLVVRVPPLKAGQKTGLDDYLVARGEKATAALLDAAEPFGPVAELLQLNAEVAYVRDPGIVVVLADGRKLSPGAFREHAFANRHYYEEVAGKHGVGLVKKPAPPAWLAWEQRHELARVTFRPGADTIVEGEYNYWPGWAVAPKRGDLRPWRELLAFLFDGFERERVWFERWCAAPLQRPGLKLFTAGVIWGRAHGTGKSLIGTTLLEIYGKNGAELAEEHLTSTYNEWAENKQFVLGDEITSGEHLSKRAMAEKLKGMITRSRLRLNPKYVPSYEVPDCINYYFTSQHPDSFFIEDTDRRYFVHEVAHRAPRPRPFYIDYVDWLFERGGAAALFHHLLHLDLGRKEDFDPHGTAPMTLAKEMMAEQAQSELGVWARKLRDEPDVVLRLGDVVASGDLFAASELYRFFDPEGRGRYTTNAVGRELRRAGVDYACGGKTVRTALGQVRLYAVRNPERWRRASSQQAATHYAATRVAPREKFKREEK